ncbi:MOSC domain-containing protein [Campylobacter mucosalis]|uniref:MOSC domain-containing protein n=1 Tax=Campylobacter mucosalis TaxID=202 RepID=UPI001470347E|nr:MOSC domain-containing protein [Campylobacter mucosalis]
MAFLKAVLVGKAQDYGSYTSAIFKVAQSDEIYANKLGFIGDEVADAIHHGGEQKAIFANSYQNYPRWEEFLSLKNLPFGAMGENLTIDGLDENSVCVGDIHKVGSLIIQVSQPRKPCSKLSKRWNNANMSGEIFKTGLSGWYYRVLEEGSCKAGDEVKILQKDSVGLSVMQLNQLFFAPNENLDILDKLLCIDTLAGNWVDDIKKRIGGSYDASYMN